MKNNSDESEPSPSPVCKCLAPALLFLCPDQSPSHFVVLQRCLSAFTWRRASSSHSNNGKSRFLPFLSSFFFFFAVPCASCTLPMPTSQMQPSHPTGCPGAEAAVPRCFDECRCRHFCWVSPFVPFSPLIEKLTISPLLDVRPSPLRIRHAGIPMDPHSYTLSPSPPSSSTKSKRRK